MLNFQNDFFRDRKLFDYCEKEIQWKYRARFRANSKIFEISFRSSSKLDEIFLFAIEISISCIYKWLDPSILRIYNHDAPASARSHDRPRVVSVTNRKGTVGKCDFSPEPGKLAQRRFRRLWGSFHGPATRNVDLLAISCPRSLRGLEEVNGRLESMRIELEDEIQFLYYETFRLNFVHFISFFRLLIVNNVE